MGTVMVMHRSVNYNRNSQENTHLSISLANTIWENIFSTSRTSKSLSLWVFASELSTFSFRRDECRSESLIAQSTRPGGYIFAICILASNVLRTACNYTRGWNGIQPSVNRHYQYNRKRIAGQLPHCSAEN